MNNQERPVQRLISFITQQRQYAVVRTGPETSENRAFPHGETRRIESVSKEDIFVIVSIATVNLLTSQKAQSTNA